MITNQQQEFRGISSLLIFRELFPDIFHLHNFLCRFCTKLSLFISFVVIKQNGSLCSDLVEQIGTHFFKTASLRKAAF